TFFVLGRTTSILMVSKVTVPDLRLQLRSVPVQWGFLKAGIEGDVRGFFSVSSPEVEMRNGWGSGARLFALLSLGPSATLETGPYFAYASYNAQLISQTRLDLGWLAGMTWILR